MMTWVFFQVEQFISKQLVKLFHPNELVQNFVVITKLNCQYIVAEYRCAWRSRDGRSTFTNLVAEASAFTCCWSSSGAASVGAAASGGAESSPVASAESSIAASSMSVAVISRASAGRSPKLDGGLPCLSKSSICNGWSNLFSNSKLPWRKLKKSWPENLIGY